MFSGILSQRRQPLWTKILINLDKFPHGFHQRAWEDSQVNESSFSVEEPSLSCQEVNKQRPLGLAPMSGHANFVTNPRKLPPLSLYRDPRARPVVLLTSGLIKFYQKINQVFLCRPIALCPHAFRCTMQRRRSSSSLLIRTLSAMTMKMLTTSCVLERLCTTATLLRKCWVEDLLDRL